MNSLHEHYYLTTAVQACTLVSIGDVFAQLIELRAAQKKEGASQLALEDYDPTRTVRMGCLGLFIGGLGTAAWLRQLERALPMRDAHQYSAFSNLPVWAYAPVLRTVGIDQATLADTYVVVVKAFLDACFWAPIANSAYLVLTPLSEGKSVEEVRGMLRERFVPVMKTELKTFFPYNLLSFSLVPPLVRPFTTGVVSMCFAVYISYMTHLASEAKEEREDAPRAMEGRPPHPPLLLRAAPTMRLEDAVEGGEGSEGSEG